MTITLSSKHTLHDLEKWVRSKFSAVKNQNIIVPKLNEVTPYPVNRMSKLARFVPVADKDILRFYWILPNY
jgi:secreted Zn-dependent insulinase-like peptidase